MSSPSELVESKQYQAIRQLVDRLAQRAVRQNEQRSDQRYALNLPTSLWSKSSNGNPQPIHAAWATDISYSGISLLLVATASPYFPFESIFVKLGAIPDDVSLIEVKPSYTQKLIDGLFRVGGSFIFRRGPCRAEWIDNSSQPSGHDASAGDPAEEAHRQAG